MNNHSFLHSLSLDGKQQCLLTMTDMSLSGRSRSEEDGIDFSLGSRVLGRGNALCSRESHDSFMESIVYFVYFDLTSRLALAGFSSPLVR